MRLPTSFAAATVPLVLSHLWQGRQSFCYGKTVLGSAKLTGVKTEHTVAKFAMSPGGHPKIEATFHTEKMYADERFLKLYLYVDENWKQVKTAPTCETKTRLAKLTQSFDFNSMPQHRRSATRQWEAKALFHVDQSQVSRPRYWYVTIADCSLEQYFHDDETPPVYFDVRIWDENPPGKFTHLPSDEKGMRSLHFYNIVFSLLLAVFLVGRARIIQKTRGEVHLAGFVVFLACGIGAFSSLCELVHLYVYQMDGIGFYFFDALGAHCEAMCDACIALLLLAVAVGWTLPSDITLRVNKDDAGSTLVHAVEGLRNPGAAVTGKNPAGLLSLGLVAVHAMLAQWGRIYDDDFDCYHDLEHPPGKALFILRLVLGFAFLLGVAGLRRSTHCSRALGSFLAKFAIVGLSWFLALPSMAMFASSALPAYRRHQVVSSWAAFVQLSSLASLAWLFTGGSSSSAYHKVSKIGGSGDGLDSSSGSGSSALGLSFRFGNTKIRMD